MGYDYKNGKKRIDNILIDSNDAKKANPIPTDEKFTNKNGYYGKVTSIFVDIRKSTKLFTNSKKNSVAKIIRCFTSEIIEILNDSNKIREIGIRGDCVYAIYANQTKQDDLDVFYKAVYINTFLKMLNKTLSKMKMQNIKAGIGIATHEDLVIKAGREGTDIYSKIWIGQGVTYASKLSDMANSKNKKVILMTSEFYNSINELLFNNNSGLSKSEFEEYSVKPFDLFYGCELYISEFNKWIDGGMK